MRLSLADRFDGMDMGIHFLTNYNLHFPFIVSSNWSLMFAQVIGLLFWSFRM